MEGTFMKMADGMMLMIILAIIKIVSFGIFNP